MSDRNRTDELTVITKAYDLILWSCNHTGKFPRNHRFVLGERIERNLYDLLEILIRAKYNRQRQELLEQANLVLEILRFQVQLAKDLQCLEVKSYGYAALAIDDVGPAVKQRAERDVQWARQVMVDLGVLAIPGTPNLNETHNE